MAWIESHEEIARHPKTKKLARKLGVSVPAAIGHIHLLWWWALNYAQDGDLSRYDNEEIADAIMYEGDAETAIEALIAAGFVDDNNGSYIIHDWYDYAGRLIEQREQHRARSKRARGKEPARTKPDDSSKCTAEIADNARTVPAASTEEPRTEDEEGAHEIEAFAQSADTVRAQCAHVPETSAHRAGLHNITKPNITIQDSTIPPLPPQGGSAGEAKTDVYTERFQEFWKAYPRKIGKDAALKAFKKRKPSAELTASMIAAIEKQKRSEQWTKDNGQYIPNPATWLNQGRWEDELPEPTAAPNYNSGRQSDNSQTKNPFIRAVLNSGNNGGT